MMRYDTWLSFNGPALGVLAAGGLIWWRIRKKPVENNDKEKNRVL